MPTILPVAKGGQATAADTNKEIQTQINAQSALKEAPEMQKQEVDQDKQLDDANLRVDHEQPSTQFENESLLTEDPVPVEDQTSAAQGSEPVEANQEERQQDPTHE